MEPFLGWIVGVLKARTGAHEVIVTIMLNYIMEYLLLYLLGLTAFRQHGRTDPISPPVANNASCRISPGRACASMRAS